MKHLAKTFDLVPIDQVHDIYEELTLEAQLRHAVAEEKRLREEYETLVASMNKLSDSYRKFFPQPISDITAVDMEISLIQQEIQELLDAKFGHDTEEPEEPEEEIPPPKTHEEKKLEKKAKRALRLYYGKISNLCHPDKTQHRGYSSDVLTRMIDLFYSARTAYKNKDLQVLIEIYTEANMLASGETLESVEENKRERIEELQRKIFGIKNSLLETQHHPVYAVYELHTNGNISQAKGVFRQILGHILMQKDDELNRLKRQLAAMKENNTWTTL